jgi:hypothetical protein
MIRVDSAACPLSQAEGPAYTSARIPGSVVSNEGQTPDSRLRQKALRSDRFYEVENRILAY